MEIKTGLPRRVVLGAAAWSLPVVTVGAAAPAFADSGAPMTKVDLGKSRILRADLPVAPGSEVLQSWFDVELTGASVQTIAPPGTPDTDLRLEITFLPEAGEPDLIFVYDPAETNWQAEGWVPLAMSGGAAVELPGGAVDVTMLVLTRSFVDATGSVPMPSGRLVGTNTGNQQGAFVFTLTASAFEGDEATLATADAEPETPGTPDLETGDFDRPTD
jgi:hypothetical protein